MPQIILSRGLKADIDEEDVALLSQYNWFAQSGRRTFYAAARIDNKYIYMHRLLLGLRPGDRRFVDHINSSGLDNRKANLRIATPTINGMNSRKQKRKCSSIFKGVYWHKQNKRWAACIKAGRKISLGTHKDEVDAAKAYNQAAIEYFGEFARLNQI